MSASTLYPNAGLVPIPGPSAPTGSSVRSAWFRLAEDSRCFDGHFEGAPILPGVAHLALALSADPATEGGRVLAGVRDLRFRRALHPGDEVEVVWIDGADDGSVRFEIRSKGQLATAGILVFESDDDVSGP